MTNADELRRLAGRLIMVGIRGARAGDGPLEEDLEICRRANVGGVILFDRDAATGEPRNIIDPGQTRALTGYLRSRLGENVIIAVDQEGGAVARLKAQAGFAPTVTAESFARLDASDRRMTAERLAVDVASAGFTLNFAPCIDVAVNPENPIISRLGRAFSSNPHEVIDCARTIVEAHHRAGVATCLKHFPGHGSSHGDSHLGAVDISDSFDPERELAPYHMLLAEVRSSAWSVCVMTAHVLDRAVDPDYPASLSAAHMQRLRRDIGFDGVVVTDSLDMGAVAAGIPIERAAVLAVAAGADIVMDCNNAPDRSGPCRAEQIVGAIVDAISGGAIPGGIDRLRRSARRIARDLRRD